MAKKHRVPNNGCVEAVCDKCGAETCAAPEGKRHRRCAGTQGAPPRAAHDPIEKSKRGKWVSK